MEMVVVVVVVAHHPYCLVERSRLCSRGQRSLQRDHHQELDLECFLEEPDESSCHWKQHPGY